MADRAELTALVAAADALAGVLEHQQVVPRRDLHDRVHVAGRTPHMHRDHRFGARPDRVLDRLRVDRDALVDVDDHRDGAGREHRHGRRHVGVRRHQHLVARPDAQGDHRRGQRIGAAAGQRHVAGAQILGVAPLEALALAADAVAEQVALADHLGDRVDLFLSNDVHGRSLDERLGILTAARDGLPSDGLSRGPRALAQWHSLEPSGNRGWGWREHHERALRCDHHRRRDHRRVHRVRAGQARLAHAEPRPAARRGLRLDRQLLRDHPHPLLDPGRRRAGLGGLFPLGRLGRLPRDRGRARPRPLPQDRLPGHEDRGQRFPAADLPPHGRARHPLGGLEPRADRRAAAVLRPAPLRPAQVQRRSGLRGPGRGAAARRRVLPLRRLYRRSAACQPQRPARRRGQGCRLPLQCRGGGDPQGRRPDRRRDPCFGRSHRCAGGGQHRRAALGQGQPPGGRARHEDRAPARSSRRWRTCPS